MKTPDILKQVDHLINLANTGLARKIRGDYGSDYVHHGDYLGFKAASLSFISLIYGETHSYYTMFKGSITDSYIGTIEGGVNILNQIKHEVENGWLTTVKQLVTAEVFSDFLEMSEHLLDEGYKDAAAVMVGSVLEEHLRQLCQSHSIDTHVLKGTDSVAKKAAAINDDLKKAGAYGPIQQKQVTAWLGTRNSAAHGHYNDYTLAEVKLMYQGVLNFLAEVK
ncbi:hypothetical protein AAFN85_09590 [Mucilaginibacter sp. CAU 1740]|uniref:hypothetical protein n=1 Tax=Mucilaginibacter sp. CAU 1740 TaxID=3140365 RepID=UPI00325B1857